MAVNAKASGLEGVVVADTALSEVDGERGRLIVAGEDVEALASRAGFEDVVLVLWRAAGMPELPADAAAVRAALGEARVAAHAWLVSGRVPDLGAYADGMDALRAATATLVARGPLGRDALALTGAVAVFAAAWWRARGGLPPLPPDPTAAHAADVLRLATGASDPARARALDAYLVTVAEHGMNASAFAARVVISTGSDVVSAVTAAIGALKGPLHGGAPGPVLDMLDAVPDADAARPWLAAQLAAGRRIMGMGHRIYRVRDPRAAVLEAATRRLAADTGAGAPGRITLARAVEAAATALLRERHPDRPMAANVEFYTAVLLEAVGLDRRAFASTFAVGRVAGWLAHAAEHLRTGRLIRPTARYIGDGL
jgi:citrate synthase